MFDPAIKGMATALAAAPGVEAVVLGGSRARGDAGPTSDYDLGLYFHTQSAFLVQELVRRSRLS
jgi:predicted nucleotidyltransferase